MSPYRRNILVGLTVMGGLAVLGWMFLTFGTMPVKWFQKGERLHVRLISDRVNGLAEGAQVLYLGQPVGQITQLKRDDNQRDVIISTDLTPPLPANVEGVIRVQTMISGATALSLELIGGKDALPQGQLLDNTTLQARYVGAELLPPEIGALAKELAETAEEVRKVQLVAHLDDSVRSASDVLKSLNDYISDPKLRDDLRTAIANFRQVTESANRSAVNIEKFTGNLQKFSDDAAATVAEARTTLQKTQGNVDDITKQVSDRMQQVSKLLDSFQSIADKIDKGQGTAGLLLNDPKLYQSLVDSSRQLNATIADLKRLFEQWEQEGVYLKVTK